MTVIRNLLRYFWEGLGGQTVKAAVSFEVPAQITLVIILAILAGWGLSLCGSEEGARLYE